MSELEFVLSVFFVYAITEALRDSIRHSEMIEAFVKRGKKIKF